MTTGRINQVTILRRDRSRANPPGGGQSSSLEGRPPHRGARPTAVQSPGARLTGFLTTIRLPRLSFPQGGPLHKRSSARRLRTVQHAPRRRRMPSAVHVVRRLAAWAYPRFAMDSDSQRPVIHRLQQSMPAGLTGLRLRHPISGSC